MQFEVHTGSRPGRPQLALLICAGLLAGTIALAWWQAGEARALGKEQQVGNTPLRVQPPKRWIRPQEDPMSFILPVQEEGWRRRMFPFERRIRFEYQRQPTFESWNRLVGGRLDGARARQTLRPARIGPYEAVEAHKHVTQAVGRRNYLRETIVRMTCLPRGQVIVVEYDPLIDLRPADTEILEDVCSTLRIEDPTLTGSREAFLEQAGLRVPLEESWHVVGTDVPQVAGVYIGGAVDGWPAWSVGILRTWRAADRTASDLLIDSAAVHWLDFDAGARLRETTGMSNAAVHTLRCPGFGSRDRSPASLWIVDRGPSQIVMMNVYASERYAAAADDVARRIATTMEILPLESFPAIEPAEAAGRRLVSELRQRGAVPRWGRGERRVRYRGFWPTRVEIAVKREARGRNAENGYEGETAYNWQLGRNALETVRWRIGPNATAYVSRADRLLGRLQLTLREGRTADSDTATREIRIEGEPPRSFSFYPGPAYVPQPVEPIIEGWVARGEEAEAIIELSSGLGPGSCTALLRQLPAEDDYVRVLRQVDYWPEGMILAYDDEDAELVYQRAPAKYLERIPPGGEPPR
jgi:hypothetical protein